MEMRGKIGTGRKGRIVSTNMQNFVSFLRAASSHSNEGVEYVRTFLILVSPLYENFLVHELKLEFSSFDFLPLPTFFRSHLISIFPVLFVGVVAELVPCFDDEHCEKRKTV